MESRRGRPVNEFRRTRRGPSVGRRKMEGSNRGMYPEHRRTTRRKRRMISYAYLAVAILAELVGTSALKLSDGMSRPAPGAVVIVGYGVAFWCMADRQSTRLNSSH